MDLPQRQPAQRYVALDGLRGIAAIAVVLFHLKRFGVYPFNSPNHAVDLFFIMSGFVIANVYEKRLAQLGISEFIKRRLLRLYPTYALALTITPLFTLFLFAISHGKMPVASVMLSIPFQSLYLPSPPSLVPPDRSFFILDGPGWSLFWELLINVAYAATLRFLTTRVLVAIVLFSAGWLSYLLFKGMPIDTGSDWPTYYVGGARVLFGFTLGVLLFRFRRPTFSTPFWMLALLFGATLCLPSALSVFIILPLVVWLATGSSTNSPLLGHLGMISYPLYAIHAPLAGVFGWLLHHLWKSMDAPMFALMDLLGSYLLAWLVATRWDKPVRTWLEQKFTDRKVTASRVADIG